MRVLCQHYFSTSCKSKAKITENRKEVIYKASALIHIFIKSIYSFRDIAYAC